MALPFTVTLVLAVSKTTGPQVNSLVAWPALRRSAGHATSELTCGPVVLDTANAKVTVNGAAIKLTSLEFRLLAYLMHHNGKVVSRTELVEHLYDQDFDRDSNTVEVFVGRLRKKLGVDVLHTIRGMGYSMTETGNAG